MSKNINKENFIQTCNKSLTMSEACSILGMHFNTFKRWANKLKCYRPNQGRKGMAKKWKLSTIKTHDILNGKHPNYQTFKLKNRLLKDNIKKDQCEVCGLSQKWNNKPIHMELEHKDGNRTNHKLENLIMICPNCHSQTEIYRAKNIHRAG